MLSGMHREIPNINRSYKVLQLSIYVATISATLLASVGHPEWMPALIALGAGFKGTHSSAIGHCCI